MIKKVKIKSKTVAPKNLSKTKDKKVVSPQKAKKDTKPAKGKSAKPTKVAKKPTIDSKVKLSKTVAKTSKSGKQEKLGVKPVKMPKANKVKEEKKIAKVEKAPKPTKLPMDAVVKEKNSKPSRKKGGRKRKNKGDEDEPEILDDILVEQLINSTKKLRSQPKKPKKLQTFVNPITSLTVAVSDTSKKSKIPVKEPKGKFELEYVVRTTVGILYEFLSSPSGLVEWFADDVTIQDGIFTFEWDGSQQKAKIIDFKIDKYIRFQWLDKPDGSFFEFKIQFDDITSDVSLIITDFADEAADLETSRRLWNSQVDQLLHVIGSFQ